MRLLRITIESFSLLEQNLMLQFMAACFRALLDKDQLLGLDSILLDSASLLLALSRILLARLQHWW